MCSRWTDIQKVSANESTNDMAKEKDKTKYGLCSGGLTTYEYVSNGIPIVIIPDDNHQIITAKHWEKLGFAKNLGNVNKATREKVDQFLREIHQGKFRVWRVSKEAWKSQGAWCPIKRNWSSAC